MPAARRACAFSRCCFAEGWSRSRDWEAPPPPPSFVPLGVEEGAEEEGAEEEGAEEEGAEEGADVGCEVGSGPGLSMSWYACKWACKIRERRAETSLTSRDCCPLG